ncbi:anthranilate synthase component I family protein [Microbacterium halotolerans]|uniref:anthranilate synthase component I family protein n=1 Tax=Microbacterium halotolerans TaxID=246613 RepID=UPI001968EB54|nr:anthranilate synthase component I family protein [Microbacterium halotolerans]
MPDQTWRALTRRTRAHITDPAALFAALYGDRPTAVWLDSARRAYGMGRWSIMGAPETGRDHVLEATPCGIRIDGRETNDLDVWDALADRIGEHPMVPIDDLPFAGGYIGYVGYGAKTIGARPAPDEPAAQLVHLSRFVVLDHDTGELIAVAVGPDDEPDAGAWLDEALAAACGARGSRHRSAFEVDGASSGFGDGPLDARDTVGTAAANGTARASVTRAQYLSDLDDVSSWLYAGDSYEACYTYNLRFGFSGDAFAVYRRLREANPAPNAAYLRLPGREVLSCSPERYLRVDPHGRAETKPIKGTVRRETDPDADARAASVLAADPKTRAENLMIVDLLRNDLGRIAQPGTVEVPNFMAVESYETVHQLVTTVQAQLRPRAAVGVRAAEALFPPGSMTGAPKQRSVELLDGLEAEPRGAYSGVLGAFSRCGAVDLSVVIRTAVVADGEVTIGTGGAITIDSRPEAEAEETVAKADALLRAFGVDHPFLR